MFTLALLAPSLLLAQGETKPVYPAGAEILSKVAARYNTAIAGKGEITMTQSAEGKVMVVKSLVKYERPAKLMLKQTSAEREPNSWLVESDGTKFVYDSPNKDAAFIGKRDRLTDVVNSAVKKFELGDIFHAARLSLGDENNIPLIFALSSPNANIVMKAMVSRIKSIKTLGMRKYDTDKKGYVLSGVIQFGIDPQTQTAVTLKDDVQPPTRFEMLVTEDFTFRRVQFVDTFTFQNGAQNLPITTIVTTVWDCNLAISDAVIPDLFVSK